MSSALSSDPAASSDSQSCASSLSQSSSIICSAMACSFSSFGSFRTGFVFFVQGHRHSTGGQGLQNLRFKQRVIGRIVGNLAEASAVRAKLHTNQAFGAAAKSECERPHPGTQHPEQGLL